MNGVFFWVRPMRLLPVFPRSLEYCKFLFNLEAAAKLTAAQQKVNAAINDRKRDRDNNKGGTKTSTSKKGSSSKTDKKKKVCGHCEKPGHDESECWLKPGQEHLRPSKKRRSDSSKGKASKPTFTTEQMTYLIQGAHKAANKRSVKRPRKRNVRSGTKVTLRKATKAFAKYPSG